MKLHLKKLRLIQLADSFADEYTYNGAKDITNIQKHVEYTLSLNKYDTVFQSSFEDTNFMEYVENYIYRIIYLLILTMVNKFSWCLKISSIHNHKRS